MINIDQTIIDIVGKNKYCTERARKSLRTWLIYLDKNGVIPNIDIYDFECHMSKINIDKYLGWLKSYNIYGNCWQHHKDRILNFDYKSIADTQHVSVPDLLACQIWQINQDVDSRANYIRLQHWLPFDVDEGNYKNFTMAIRYSPFIVGEVINEFKGYHIIVFLANNLEKKQKIHAVQLAKETEKDEVAKNKLNTLITMGTVANLYTPMIDTEERKEERKTETKWLEIWKEYRDQIEIDLQQWDGKEAIVRKGGN